MQFVQAVGFFFRNNDIRIIRSMAGPQFLENLYSFFQLLSILRIVYYFFGYFSRRSFDKFPELTDPLIFYELGTDHKAGLAGIFEQ